MTHVKNVFSNRVEKGSAWVRGQQSLDQMIKRVQNQLRHVYEPTSRHIRHARDAMTVTTRAWERAGKNIELYVNPLDMNWTLPKRGSVVKTQAGAVRNTWRNRYRGTYYDEGTINITFQTGNIMPYMGYPESLDLMSLDDVSRALANPKVPPGLLNFYRFLELLDQPMLWGAGENHHMIRHHSRVFPNMTLLGYFTEEGINFSEVATDGNRLQWTSTFQVYRTSPRINSASSLATQYVSHLSSIKSEVVGQENIDLYTFGEGVSSLPGTMPAGQPKTGTNPLSSAKAVASSGQKTSDIADRKQAAGRTTNAAQQLLNLMAQ